MSGETAERESGWTVDTLHAQFVELRRTDLTYIEKRFGLAEAAVAAALASAERANIKAETATEKRFDAVNEFRATLADQASRLMPRAEVEAIIKSQNEKIEDLRGTRRLGVTSIGTMVLGVAIVVGVLVQILVLVINHA
jgi:hypothetical protein